MVPLCGDHLAFITLQRRGYRIRLYPTSLSAGIWYDRDDFTGIENFLRAYLRAGDVVVDVGANIGTTALTASTVVGTDGRVTAIEAHPRTFRYLKGNIELNERTNIEAVNLAVGETEGTIAFSNASSDDQNAVLSQGGISVPMRRLDSIIDHVERIALIKIDVEGYELHVLRGAIGLLQNTDCLVFEVDNERYRSFGYCLADIVALLKQHGFDTFQVIHDGALAPVQAEVLGPSALGGNLLATRDPGLVAERLAASAFLAAPPVT